MAERQVVARSSRRRIETSTVATGSVGQVIGDCLIRRGKIPGIRAARWGRLGLFDPKWRQDYSIRRQDQGIRWRKQYEGCQPLARRDRRSGKPAVGDRDHKFSARYPSFEKEGAISQ